MTSVTTAELVEAIVEELKPFRPRSKWDSTLPDDTEVRTAVCTEVKALRSIVASFYSRSRIQQTRDDARDIVAAVQNLRDALARVSPEMRARLKLDFKDPPIFVAMDGVIQECEIAENKSLAAGRKDQVRRRCVQRAGVLIQTFSSQKLAATDENLFPKIAGYLYEIVGPDEAKKNSGFRRLCEEIISAFDSP